MSATNSPERRRSKKPLSKLISSTLVNSAFDKPERSFSPEGSIDKLITTASIDRALRAKGSKALADGDLVEFIYRKAKRVFAIALCANLAGEHLLRAMEFFKSHNMSDDGLPFDKAQWKQHLEGNSGRNENAESSSISYDSDYSDYEDGDYSSCDDGGQDEDPWPDVSIGQFCTNQWAFCAPVFSTSKFNHDLESNAVLPFTRKDDVLVARGSLGRVFKCEIHKCHLDIVNSDFNHPEYVAVKEVQRDVHQDRNKMVRAWENEAQVLWGMNSLNQKHIVRFITAFRRGEDDHYLMFEWANGGNLRNLWQNFRRPALTGNLVKETILQLCGLAQAIERAHYPEVEGGLSYRHGDLKPENILWCKDEGGDETKLGTLKIGDWGLAKGHEIVTELRTNKTTTEYGTRRYEPPEERTGDTTSLTISMPPGKIANRRSRLYDIWAMGCIALEFLVWLMYGLDGLNKFNRAIETQLSEPSPFYEFALKDDGKVKAKVHRVVEKWMDYMARDAACAVGTTALGNLLELIRNRLLVVKLPVTLGTSQNIVPTNSLAKLDIPDNSNLQDPSPPKSSTNSTNVPEINITDTDPRKPPVPPESEPRPVIKPLSKGRGRALATNFHNAMLEISGKDEVDTYWLTGLPGPPPDHDFSERPIIAQGDNVYQTEATVSGTDWPAGEQRSEIPLRPAVQTPGARTERIVSA